jgi:hypothetical protein
MTDHSPYMDCDQFSFPDRSFHGWRYKLGSCTETQLCVMAQAGVNSTRAVLEQLATTQQPAGGMHPD